MPLNQQPKYQLITNKQQLNFYYISSINDYWPLIIADNVAD